MRAHPLLALAFLTSACAPAAQPFFDRSHPSRVFGQPRRYRIFLPPGYDYGKTAYPVIYYFHGHSDRYTLEHYDKGADTVPKIAGFVARHPVIVVSVDGYVARDYTGFYGGSPWDVRIEGGDFDFGEYFLELAAHIDSAYRTLTDRRHRATSGLSMGGFMSLWLSARYPDRIGSASAFNPGPEFYTGDKGRRVLWRPKDHTALHNRSMVRLIRASGDYISQYHEETRAAYARSQVDFEFRQDEYHRHWATSIGETFDFHMRAFANSALDNVPEVWDYSSAYRRFSVWGCDVTSEGDEPGFTDLTEMRQGGFRVQTRKWAPGGPPVERRIRIVTAPLYEAGKEYTVTDYHLESGDITRFRAAADKDGRMTVETDGRGHQISFAGEGVGALPPVLLPAARRGTLRVPPGRDVALPVRLYNPRAEAMENLRVRLSSEYPAVALLRDTAEVPVLKAGETADLSGTLRARFTSGAGDFAPARISVSVGFDGWHSVERDIDLEIVPEIVPAPLAVEVLDGRTRTFGVFRQKGNQGGGASVERTVTEGKGNGNGILEPGEEATVWVRLRQGMDAFDKNNWYRTKVTSGSPWLDEVADIEEQKQREWTGAKERTSVIRLSEKAPPGAVIPVLLENESWSFHFTPDVRYGRERLYQAFQLHSRHLHRWEIRTAGPPAPK